MRQWIAPIALALLASPAFAQDAYPSRPITMVIAFPPGGVTDVTARPTALAMERVLKQRVIIENRPGAAGATGNAYVDRKSTRLNSSHTVISYAVFCLKKKKKE